MSAPAAAPPAAATPPAARIPFVYAAHEHVEPAFQSTDLLGANSIEKGPFDIPAYGFIRHIRLECVLSGGTLGAGVLAADFPWSIFERISLTDVNGSPIFEMDGYAAFVANVIGGYAYQNDPRQVDFDGTINGRFYLRIPVEINHFNGLGAISNQNAASSYKFAYRLRNTSPGIFSTAPTTPPSITVRAFLEAWSLPNEVDLGGNPQEQLPPMHGTSQYWSQNSKAVIAGANTLPITRVGNRLRNLVFISRNAAGARVDTAMFDPITFQWDANTLVQESQAGHKISMKEKLQLAASLDVGVFCYPFTHSELNKAGDGPASLWLATVQSSRLELSGNAAVAGSIQVLTNDVAPVEVDPRERFEAPNRTGYNPQNAPGAGAVRVQGQ